MTGCSIDRAIRNGDDVRSLLLGLHALGPLPPEDDEPLSLTGRYRRYHAGTDGRGRVVYFCWATSRNPDGYVLGWREVASKRGDGRRDQWCKAASGRR